jgi:hypothetical protein
MSHQGKGADRSRRFSVPQSQSRFLRWRISPRSSTCLDFLAQMNLVLDILRMPFGDKM